MHQSCPRRIGKSAGALCGCSKRMQKGSAAASASPCESGSVGDPPDLEEVVSPCQEGEFEFTEVNGVRLRFQIWGTVRAGAVPIVFTPGGQGGIAEPSTKGVCLHPTRFLSKSQIEQELLQGRRPSWLRAKVKSVFAPFVCPCGLMEGTWAVCTCTQRRVLQYLLKETAEKCRLREKKGDGGEENEGGEGAAKERPDFFLLRWDRRNCGSSDYSYGDELSRRGEPEIQAEDLACLLSFLEETKCREGSSESNGSREESGPGKNTRASQKAKGKEKESQASLAPAILVGNSSGARLSLIFAIRHEPRCAGLVLMNMTQGVLASAFLAEHYYRQYSRIAREGGMQAVVSSPFYTRGCRAGGDRKREQLMSTDTEAFCKVTEAWADWMERGADEGWPAIGVPESEARKAAGVPSFVLHTFVPEDGMHTLEGAQRLGRVLGGNVMSSRMEKIQEWVPKVAEFIASIL